MKCAAALSAVILLFAGCTTSTPSVDSYPTDAARRVTVHGVDIHYFDFNRDAPGTPIVWIHGYSGTAFETTYIQDRFAGANRLIAPDLPGNGYSQKPDVDYTLDYFLEFLAGFLEVLELDRYVLVGHSMGGLIAGTFAAGEPAGLERLILVAPYGLEGEAGAIAEFLATTGVLVDYGLVLHNETLIDLGLQFGVFHDPDRIPDDLVNYMKVSTFHTPNAIPALASITQNMIGTQHDAAAFERIAVPTLIIWGARDRVLAFRFAADFNRLIPGSQLQAIPEAGHLPHVELPDLTAGIIRDFLR